MRRIGMADDEGGCGYARMGEQGSKENCDSRRERSMAKREKQKGSGQVQARQAASVSECGEKGAQVGGEHGVPPQRGGSISGGRGRISAGEQQREEAKAARPYGEPRCELGG